MNFVQILLWKAKISSYGNLKYWALDCICSRVEVDVYANAPYFPTTSRCVGHWSVGGTFRLSHLQFQMRQKQDHGTGNGTFRHKPPLQFNLSDGFTWSPILLMLERSDGIFLRAADGCAATDGGSQNGLRLSPCCWKSPNSIQFTLTHPHEDMWGSLRVDNIWKVFKWIMCGLPGASIRPTIWTLPRLRLRTQNPFTMKPLQVTK